MLKYLAHQILNTVSDTHINLLLLLYCLTWLRVEKPESSITAIWRPTYNLSMHLGWCGWRVLKEETWSWLGWRLSVWMWYVAISSPLYTSTVLWTVNKPKNPIYTLCSYLKWRPHVGKEEINHLSSITHSINIMKIGVTTQGHLRLYTQYIFTHAYFELCTVFWKCLAFLQTSFKLKVNWYTNMLVGHLHETFLLPKRPPLTQRIILQVPNTQKFTTMI